MLGRNLSLPRIIARVPSNPYILRVAAGTHDCAEPAVLNGPAFTIRGSILQVTVRRVIPIRIGPRAACTCRKTAGRRARQREIGAVTSNILSNCSLDGCPPVAKGV